MVELSTIQKIRIKLFGNVYVGHRRRPRWKGSLPFYAFRCKEHGIVVNYPFRIQTASIMPNLLLATIPFSCHG